MHTRKIPTQEAGPTTEREGGRQHEEDGCQHEEDGCQHEEDGCQHEEDGCQHHADGRQHGADGRDVTGGLSGGKFTRLMSKPGPVEGLDVGFGFGVYRTVTFCRDDRRESGVGNRE